MGSKRRFGAAHTDLIWYRTHTSKKRKNTDINLDDVDDDEDVIKYCFMPSLQHITMSSIIITLWNQSYIKHEIIKLFTEFEYDDYQYSGMRIRNLFLEIDAKVLNKLSQLTIPSRIRKILSNIVHPIGQEIFTWIEYQDKYIFNPSYNYQNGNYQFIAINYIDYLVWTARGVIDYEETAKTLLAKEKRLSDINKYVMACSYCFEDNIAMLTPKVNNNILVLQDLERQTMVYFWTAHITGDFTKLDQEVYLYNQNFYTNYSRNECLFRVLIKSVGSESNKVAIKYMWDELNYKEKSRQIVPAIDRIKNNDIRCFLLSQMNKKQKYEVFTNCDTKLILLSFLDDWLWGQYFLPTMHNIWDIICGFDYHHVLGGVVDNMKKNHENEDTEKCNQYRSIFKELWQYAPKHLKDYVFKYENGKNCNILLKLFSKENIDLIQLVLHDASDTDKKKIIFSAYGINICHFLITSNQWDLLEMFSGHSLFSRKDVERLKRKLIRVKGLEIAVHFIKNKEWDKVEQFLQWAFKSDDEIREYKVSLLHSAIPYDLLQLMTANDKADFTELEFFFKCCDSNNQGVAKIKAEIPGRYFRELICKLIKENKFKLLSQILNWCFSNDQNQVNQFKQYFYQNDAMLELLVDLIKQEDQFQSLEKFIDYWCCTEKEKDKFKTYMLYPEKNTASVCRKLLYEREFEILDEFVIWCCNSLQIPGIVNHVRNELIIDFEASIFWWRPNDVD